MGTGGAKKGVQIGQRDYHLGVIMDILELQTCISRGPGLVAGPGLTSSNSRESQCLNHLRTTFPSKADLPFSGTYLDYADIVISENPAQEQTVRRQIHDFFADPIVRNPQLELIAQVNWSGIISLSSDDHLRSKVADFLYHTPTKWSLTTISTPRDSIKLTTVPYYALMGDINDKLEASRLCVTRAEYLAKVRQWAAVLRTFPNIIKADPLIFLGTESIVERVFDFMNALLVLHPFVPSKLIFLDNDPTGRNATLRNLVAGFCPVETVTSSLAEIGEMLSRENLAIRQLPLFAAANNKVVDIRALVSVEDQVEYVPRRDEMKVNPEERNRLLDSLFRPTNLDWAPYALDMEFKRDLTEDVIEQIQRSFSGAEKNGGNIIHVRGEAGIGKTVALRTVAFRCADEGKLCLWIKKSYGEISGGRFDAVITALSKSVKSKDTEVVFFLDDPWGSRVRPREVISALQSAPFRWVLVLCDRKTDAVAVSAEGFYDSTASEQWIEAPDQFTRSEIERLPSYLVSLGLATDIEDAKWRMPAPGMKQSRDILCSLWILLPQTQSSIEASVVGEYHRLGEIEEAITAFAAAASGKSVAKSAYEFVTTTSGFRATPLPVEVLVSALRVSYSQWLESCKEKKPLWGLLYDEDYPGAETWAYRTRNTVVTDVLLKVLNQGMPFHTGEFRCLKALLSACTSATAPYRTFIKDILVERRDEIEKRFTCDQAMELYDAALSAYPRDYGVVVHHKCIAKRRMGGDAQEVYEGLTGLLAKPDGLSDDNDSRANVSNSAAATMCQLINEKRIDPVDGAEMAFAHITDALAGHQLSLHPHHVQAKLLVTLAEGLRTVDAAAFMQNLERAARIVDRAFLLMTPRFKGSQAGQQSLALFHSLQQDILSAFPDRQIGEQKALELFQETGNQAGLAFAARMLLGKAIESGKGGRFKDCDNFIRRCFKELELKSVEAVPELRLCRVDLVIHWNVRQNKGPVYWEQFEADLSQLLQLSRYRDDVIYIFYAAVGRYNLKQFIEAENLFQTSRSKLQHYDGRSAVRCFFLGDKSQPKVLEGKVSKDRAKRFVFSSELETDVMVRHEDFRGHGDDAVHFRIGFSLLGPIAIERSAADTMIEKAAEN
jgi:thymidylate kinase